MCKRTVHVVETVPVDTDGDPEFIDATLVAFYYPDTRTYQILWLSPSGTVATPHTATIQAGLNHLKSTPAFQSL